jgi:hypothetical protein
MNVNSLRDGVDASSTESSANVDSIELGAVGQAVTIRRLYFSSQIHLVSAESCTDGGLAAAKDEKSHLVL